jgi:hypothetical protein
MKTPHVIITRRPPPLPVRKLAPAEMMEAVNRQRTAFLTHLHELDAATLARIVENIRRAEDEHEWQTPSIKRQMDDAGLGHSGQF